MWSFVLFMVLGTYWLIRVIAEKSNDRLMEIERDREYKEKWNDYCEFSEKYSASKELYEKAKVSAYTDSEEAMEIRARIEDEAGIKATYDMVIRAILAKDQKLPHKCALGGFRTYPGDRDDARIERNFMYWYDKELKKYGFPYDLLFSSIVNLFGDRSNDVELEPVRNNPMLMRGKYLWYPIRLDIDPGEILTVHQVYSEMSQFRSIESE